MDVQWAVRVAQGVSIDIVVAWPVFDVKVEIVQMSHPPVSHYIELGSTQDICEGIITCEDCGMCGVEQIIPVLITYRPLQCQEFKAFSCVGDNSVLLVLMCVVEIDHRSDNIFEIN